MDRAFATLLELAVVAAGASVIYSILKNPGRWTRQVQIRSETEIIVVVQAAEQIGRKMGRPCVDTALFVRASLCNAGVAAAVVRAGWTVIDASRELDALLVSGPEEPHDGTPLSPPFRNALQEAWNAAARRGERIATLADVLNAIRDHLDTPASAVIRSRVIRFEDQVLVSVVPTEQSTAADRFIYIMNDAVSPMESVVTLLTTTIGHDLFHAAYVMSTIHHHGYGCLGPYEADATDGVLQRLEYTARSLGMEKLVFARQAPNTTGWKKTEQGLLPTG